MFKAIKNHPVVTFYILAFALAWCIKIPVVLSNTNNIVLRLLPSFLPAVAALITTAVIVGRGGVRDLLRQIGKRHISPVWYLIALVGPMLLNLLASILAIPFGQAFPGFTFPGIIVLPKILVASFFAYGEELGWRGFALPRLQNRFNALVASLIVGLLWWAWHLPETLATTGFSFEQIASRQLRDLVLDLATSILITWIYNSTGRRSVFLASLFHIGIGLLAQFLVAQHAYTNVSPTDILLVGLFCVAAIIVVLVNGPTYLTHNKPETSGTPMLPINNQLNTSTVVSKGER